MPSFKFYRLGFYPLRRDESVRFSFVCCAGKKKSERMLLSGTTFGVTWRGAVE